MPDKDVIATTFAPGPLRGAPYSQAVCFGELVFVSGLLGNDPTTGDFEDGIAQQTHRIFRNAEAILAAAGTELRHLLKTTVYLRDFEDWEKMNTAYAQHVGDSPPARATVAVSGLPQDALLEIDFIAHRSPAA